MKNLTITDQHPDKKPTQKMVIELMGGSPWLNYIWIDGVCYTIIYERTVRLRKTSLTF